MSETPMNDLGKALRHCRDEVATALGIHRLLRILSLAIGSAPLLLCKVGLHRWRHYAVRYNDRCTRCLRWREHGDG